MEEQVKTNATEDKNIHKKISKTKKIRNMQIKNIIALIILASLPNVSCQSIREAEEINVYH